MKTSAKNFYRFLVCSTKLIVPLVKNQYLLKFDENRKIDEMYFLIVSIKKQETTVIVTPYTKIGLLCSVKINLQNTTTIIIVWAGPHKTVSSGPMNDIRCKIKKLTLTIFNVRGVGRLIAGGGGGIYCHV